MEISFIVSAIGNPERHVRHTNSASTISTNRECSWKTPTCYSVMSIDLITRRLIQSDIQSFNIKATGGLHRFDNEMLKADDQRVKVAASVLSGWLRGKSAIKHQCMAYVDKKIILSIDPHHSLVKVAIIGKIDWKASFIVDDRIRGVTLTCLKSSLEN